MGKKEVLKKEGRRDQKEAAIITSALKPSIVSKTFLFTFLKKHTTNAP